MILLRRKQIALLLFMLALVARLVFVALHGVLTSPDTSDYQQIARNVLRVHTFSRDARPPVQSDIYRPPIYPLFLASLILVGDSSNLPATAQSALDALVCALVFLMASRVARRWVAVATSLLYALHPGAVTASASLLSEALFTALLTTGVFLALIAAERLNTVFALCSGMAFGLATLCRSIGVLYLTSAALVLIMLRFRRTALAIALAAVVIIAPWVIRCSQVAGRFAFVQAPSALPFYLPTLWWLDQNDEPAVWRSFFASDPYGVRLAAAATPSAVMSADDFGRHQAIANVRRSAGGYLHSRIRTYPHLFLNTFDHFTGINRSLGDVAGARDVPVLAIKLVLMVLFTALPMAAACVGLGRSRRTLTGSLVAAIWIVTLAAHVLMWIEYRYWLPIVPFHLVTAALGIQRVLDRTGSGSPGTKSWGLRQESGESKRSPEPIPPNIRAPNSFHWRIGASFR